MTDPTVIRKSVTRDDYATNPYTGPSGLFFFYPTPYSGPAYAPLPRWWSVNRDFALRETVHREAMWAAAISKAITKTAALGWEVSDTEDSKVRVKRGQDVYMTALAGMHRGWVPFLSMHLRDYLLTDNGSFVEIIRATSAAGSRILGIAHLDGVRCTRTGDADIPVLYRDRLGRLHEMRGHQVMTFADMPDPSETWNGVGFCAASRAYLTIAKLAALEQYVYEKAAGDGATEISFIKGLSPTNLESAILTADGEQKRKGAAYYKGKILVPVMGDVALEVQNVPLKNVPDGFDSKQERDNAYMIYANCIGIPVQDIQPLSGQGLGTGTQTVILAEEAEGQGLAAWRSQWIHANNEYILPETTTFAWSNKFDTRDQKAKAEVQDMQSTVIQKLVGNPTQPGIINAAQGLNLAVDLNLVPREFMPEQQDATPGGTLSDSEKPLTEQPEAQAQALLAQARQPAAPILKTFWRNLLMEYKDAGDPYLNEDPTRIDAILDNWSNAFPMDAATSTITVDDVIAAANLSRRVQKDKESEALIDEQLDAALALVTRVLSKEGV